MHGDDLDDERRRIDHLIRLADDLAETIKALEPDEDEPRARRTHDPETPTDSPPPE